MAELQVVFWRDIPAQVIAKAGRRTAKRQLSGRFESAIDRAAMRSGMRATDDYLGEWRRLNAGPCEDDLEAAAAAHAARLEDEYPDERLNELVASGGIERTNQADTERA